MLPKLSSCRCSVSFLPPHDLHPKDASIVAPQFIYVMKGLRKVIPPSRIILDDIWLSFYPGAKIGVLGPNGAGKSSLLRIMAGVDSEFQGEAWPHKGTRVAFLPQEPELDPTKDVKGNVDEALKGQRAKLDRFNAVSAKFAEPMGDDAMLSYQCTSFHDAPTLRQLFNLRPAPEFEKWMEALGLMKNGVLTEKAGDPTFFLKR